MRKRNERRFGGCSFHSDGHEHFLWLIIPHWDEVNRKTHLRFMCAYFARNEGDGETTEEKYGGREEKREREEEEWKYREGMQRS